METLKIKDMGPKSRVCQPGRIDKKLGCECLIVILSRKDYNQF